MKKRNDSGFTLIELVLVVGLLSVFVGLTVPGFRQGFQRFSEERAASEMEELSRYARSIAIGRGVPYQLSFADQDGTYRLLRGEKGQFVLLEGRIGRRRHLPEGARAQGSSLEVTYLPNGTAVGGPLEFWRDSKPVWRLQVDPVLGETQLLETLTETAG